MHRGSASCRSKVPTDVAAYRDNNDCLAELSGGGRDLDHDDPFPDEPAERKHLLRDVSEGLRYVLGHPVLRNISLMMALINFVSATTFSQLVLFASVELDVFSLRAWRTRSTHR